MHTLFVSKLSDMVLCVVIVLTKEGADEYLEGINIEAMSVRKILKECTKILQRCRDISVGSVACPL